MSDSDSYDESSDEDYVPHAEEVSEEEESGEDEDFNPAAEADGPSAANGAGSSAKKGKRKKAAANKGNLKRQRKGGIKLDDKPEENEEDVEKERKEREEEDKRIAEEVKKEMESMKEKKEEKKIDDLWSSFLSDVKHKPKSAMSAQSSTSSKSSNSLASLTKPVTSSPTTNINKKQDKVTITKIFDFAGEEVRVTKEVAADSKEARMANKTEDTSSEASASPTPGPGLPGAKKSAGGLGSVLGKIGKKTKISVLDKSKLDWDSFKQDEGIDDELKIHNRGKDGYIERKKFLERVDHNQFEIERNLRLGKR